MARQPRIVLEGQPQHVVQRGNNRDIIFVADEDYQLYLETLAEACKRFDCDVHAYVLMTNHVHLLITPHQGNGISKVMQSLGRKYVQYFNHQYRRSGTLWEGRYKSTLLDSERYLLTCYRYIEFRSMGSDSQINGRSMGSDSIDIDFNHCQEGNIRMEVAKDGYWAMTVLNNK